MTYQIIIVDDDTQEIGLLKQFLESKLDCCVRTVDNGRTMIDEFTGSQQTNYDLMILDLYMPGIGGTDVLQAIRPVHPKLPVIVRTGSNRSQDAVAALKAGANDFINKTDTPATVERVVKSALISSTLHREMARFRNGSAKDAGFSDILGEALAVKEMVTCARKAADSDIPVLLEGESGSGKELLARAIHHNSDRSGKPFIVVNCGAVPEHLLESALFGHEKDAFKGAIYRSQGKLREADGGTVFLDEVADISQDAQVRLLRLLQTGEIVPVGTDKAFRANVRVISATARDLTREMHNNNFREDLYYRLNVFPVHVPALRDRDTDIPLLVRYYVSKFSQIEEKFVRQLPSETMQLLQGYSWPGNIRQLKNIIYRAIVLSDSGVLAPNCFPQVNSDESTQAPVSTAQHTAGPDRHTPQGASGAMVPLIGKDGHFRSVDAIEKETIVSAMRHYHGCISEVARRLGLGRSTLYRKMRKYDIEQDIYPQDDAADNAR